MWKHEDMVLSCKGRGLGSGKSEKSSMIPTLITKNQAEFATGLQQVNVNEHPTRWGSECSISIPEHTQGVSKSLALWCHCKEGNLIPASLFHYPAL